MSYNIDTWKTKRLENFVIPLSAFDETEIDCEKATINLKTGHLVLDSFVEDGEIVGTLLDNGRLLITSIHVRGEGSGHFYHGELLPLFEHSTGILEAKCAWEGGDSITRLFVKDGVVTDEEIEL